jgi:acetyl-CoA acetyltransferase
MFILFFAIVKNCFSKDGTITAANASKINDGAAVCLLMTRRAADELGCKPLARIIGKSSIICISTDEYFFEICSFC